MKVFPCAQVGGASYIKALKAPFPQIPLIAAGGVNQQTAGAFILAGASAVGVGGDLIPRSAIELRQPERIRNSRGDSSLWCGQRGRNSRFGKPQTRLDAVVLLPFAKRQVQRDRRRIVMSADSRQGIMSSKFTTADTNASHDAATRNHSNAGETIASLDGRPLGPNRGVPLDLGWVEDVRVNTSAVERRAATLGTRRTVKKEWQAAWLFRAISCMDLTTLSGDDTDERVERLCAKARQPIQHDSCRKLGIESLGIKVGAVCVYHAFVETASRALEGTGIPVAAVSTGFPAGPLRPLRARRRDPPLRRSRRRRDRRGHHARACLRRELAGALRRGRRLQGACGPAHMKTILGTGDLLTLRNVGRASGGDDGRRRFHQDLHRQGGRQRHPAGRPGHGARHPRLRRVTGYVVGFKPAGGISHRQGRDEFRVPHEGGARHEWLQPGLFRFGASSLLADIERQLEYFVTGRYAAEYRMPLA